MDALIHYGFLQRALFAGVFIAVVCALLGVFLILRRDSMIGHGLAHVTFAGVAVGLVLHIMPMIAALAVAVITALGIMKLKLRAGLYGDTAIAIFSSTGFAAGILLVSLSKNFNVDLFGYLFGDILAIKQEEVWLSIGFTILVTAVVVINYKKFLYATFDRESAKVSGIKVEKLDSVLTVLTAVTVVLGMKVVGILLVSALLVIPAAAGLQLASNFKQSIIVSVSVSVISVIAGLYLSVVFDFPASGTIVILSFFIFIIFFGIRRKK